MLTIRKKCSAFQTCTHKWYYAKIRSFSLTLSTHHRAPLRFASFLLQRLLPTIIFILSTGDHALATQSHGHPAGLYAHQMAHVFFLFSMGLFIFWLRQRGLTRSAGWRYIQYASLFFIFWNVNAFVVHLVEEQMAVLEITRISAWQINIQAQPGFQWLGTVYYITKLDHLLCVPALVFLYIGLRRLLDESIRQNRGNV